jgi:monomeric sarcosine oxidase
VTGASLPERVRCVVVGMGAFGSAAAYRLARRVGADVLAIEQFAPGHTRGSSQDHSRIIRHAYGSPVYTALTPAMFAAWREVEAESAMALLARTGGLDLGDPTVPGSLQVVHDIADALAAGGIGFETLDADSVRERWPQWRLPEGLKAVYQPDAGSLDIGRACAAHLALAAEHGALLRPGTRALSLTPAADGSGVRVQTDQGSVDAETVVVCTGKWTNRLLGSARELPLAYTREQVSYFVPERLRAFAADRFPVWIRHGRPCFYGLGVHGVPAVKAAEDLGGPRVAVDDQESPIDPHRAERVREFLRAHLPQAAGRILESRACLYELPPDRHFFLGPVVGCDRILVAIGAGHGAKFAALFGVVLSELALDGATGHPVEAFAPARPFAPRDLA